MSPKKPEKLLLILELLLRFKLLFKIFIVVKIVLYFQLLCALRNLSINDTVEQCSYAGCYDYDGNPGKILDKTCYDRKKTKEFVIQFSKLLEVNC